jgi:DNA-binding CsgD family transcriptional regulator
MRLEDVLDEQLAPPGLAPVCAFLVADTPGFEGLLAVLAELSSDQLRHPEARSPQAVGVPAQHADSRATYIVCLYRVHGGPSRQPHSSSASRPLTPREKDVMECSVRGLDPTQTAEVLGISVATVYTHLRAIYRKLNVDKRVAAVGAAMAMGAVSTGP